jgi:hypothetical protein
MDKHDKRGRRFSAEEKAAAVRMVRTPRAELGTNQGTVRRVATPLGYGPESVRAWVTRPTLMKAKVKGSLRTLLLKFVDLNRNCGR